MIGRKHDFEFLDVDADEDVTTISINRPDKANCLSCELISELNAAVDRAYQDDTRIVVLTGKSDVFCGGMDLSESALSSLDSVICRFLKLELLLQKIQQAPFVSVALVNGAAIGAGADLVVACSYRIAHSSAYFRFPGASFGVVLGTSRLKRLIGADAARDIILRSRRVGVAEGLQIGLLSNACNDCHEAVALVSEIRSRAAIVGKRIVGVLNEAEQEANNDRDISRLLRSLLVDELGDRLANFRKDTFRKER